MAADATHLCHFAVPTSAACAVKALAGTIGAWFESSFNTPTPAQRLAWPSIGRGENLLLCAPTGTGKTQAAFLPIISHLCDKPAEGTACLYIAPLKALARDISKNLHRALGEIGALAPTGTGDSRIRVGLRTGDTPTNERRKQLEQPPHILLTTPESLAVLLTNPRFCHLVRDLRWIVVDEVHVNNVALRPAYRAKGLGSALMRRVLTEARRLGAVRATLEVRASNMAARRFYETMGFEVTATRPRYYTDPTEDALILWRELT
jgi:ATP-dependent Lhr-like helicase